MAALNFPANPSLNDEYNANSATWRWNGTAWVRLGDPGAQGAQGRQGAVGAQGNQGRQGADGVQGAAGAQGAVGAQGDVGAQGAQGSQGSAGAQGTVGAQGDAGAQGDVGAQGATGAQGAQGATGAQGAQGAVGAQGDVGAQGAQGAQGFQGRQGAVGAQGDVGAQGAQGAQGFQGRQGAVGAQGAQGATGAQGSAGAQGATGAQGAQGATGPVGGGTGTDYNDNVKVRFGTGNDFEIYHDGTYNNIKSSNGELHLKDVDGGYWMRNEVNGAVSLYYDGSLRLNTYSAGIQVNGVIVADAFLSASRYWRFVGGSSTNQHAPRASRIILSDGTTDYTIQTFTSDNCSDSGTIYSDGSVYSYDFGSGNDKSICKAKLYVSYSGARGANYSVQYSLDNSTWLTAFSGVMNASGCGLLTGTGGLC